MNINFNRGAIYRISQIGIEIVVFAPDAEVPVSIDQYTGDFHPDGSACYDNCDGPTKKTTISAGQTVDIADWHWHAGGYNLIGWVKTGASDEETKLSDMIDTLRDHLSAETELHNDTDRSLRQALDRLSKSDARVCDLQKSLRLSRALSYDTQRRHDVARANMFIGWAAAIVFAIAAVVQAVI